MEFNVELGKDSLITHFSELLIKDLVKRLYCELEMDILNFLKKEVKVFSFEEFRKHGDLVIYCSNGRFTYIFKWKGKEIFRKELKF